MAASSITLHLERDDAPAVTALPTNGTLALWLTKKHSGPTICGKAEALAKLRDAIDAFLTAQPANEAA